MDKLHLLSPRGFRAAGVSAGIKSSGKADVALLICDVPAVAAASFTTNKVYAAPIRIGREHIARGTLRGVVVNSGNANACTGKRGERDARRMCTLASSAVACQPKEILPASTGIIGHALPMDRVESGIADAALKLGDTRGHAQAFMRAILTTDKRSKSAAARLRIGRKTVTIAGVCKGSGMIGPRMSTKAPHATMLAFLTTDARFSSARPLASALQNAVDESFNAVTVDDHASTNDMAVILASAAADAAIVSSADQRRFAAALDEVCQSLAYQIAADGEGATKVIEVKVDQAANSESAWKIARTIANSPLVKCAMHGNDPNWGRIVSAAGYCGAAFEPEKCVLRLQGKRVFDSGRPVRFDAAALSKALDGPHVEIELDCRMGDAEARVWTCDLSKEYVTINADYHT